MKKIISILLCAVLALSCLAVTGAAYTDRFDRSEYPLIVIGGFSSSQLVRRGEDGSEEVVWWMDVNPGLKTVMDNLVPLIKSLGYLDAGDYETIREFLAPYLYQYLGFLACDKNGKSVEELYTHVANTAEASRWSDLELDGDYVLYEHIKDYVDGDNTFVFANDFRMPAAENAAKLGELVDDVLETTGAEKVNILAQSYGGQLAGAYVSLDPVNNGKKLNNVMMMVPALGGATLASDILSDNLDLNVGKLLEYLEYGFLWETDFHLLFEDDWLNIVDILFKACHEDLMNIAGYWPAIWDFVPYGDYRHLIDELLDPVESKDLIESTTRFHEDVMAKYGENFRKAQAAGATISIMAGMGIPAVTGSQVHSDGIIPTAAATGATCAPYGKRFSDGYSTAGRETTVPGYTHISPSMEVDASTCYLPDNTWLVDGLFHGLERMDEYTRTLMLRQSMSADPLRNAYQSREYPQFHTAASAAYVVHAKFNSSVEGYVSSADSSLILENDSSSPLLITGITAKGSGLTFRTPYRVIPAGKTVSVPFEGTLPKMQKIHFNLTVTYQQLGTSSLTPFGQRIFDFTIKNGGAFNYSVYKPYTDNNTTTLPQAISKTAGGALNASGIPAAASAIISILVKFVRFFDMMVKLFK